MTPLVIVGSGGHGREILDVVRAVNTADPRWDVLGFVDDSPEHLDRLLRLDHEVLGDIEHLARLGGAYALGIGTSAVRRIVARRLEGNCTPVTLVHPGASIGSDTELGEGVVVFDRTVVTTNVVLGDHTHLNVGCAVQHDSRIGAYVQFSPGVMVNGDCSIGDDVFLGTGAIVTRGITIGEGARVGAGSVVLDDVADGVTVVGAPARPILPGA